jgi:rSAM/selenodomain-associated transferase 1
LRDATPKRPEPALIVFARSPDPGRVKTRLVPLLGEKGAARLQARMVEKALTTARAAGFEAIDLYCTPGIDGEFFRSMQRRFGVRLRAQGRGDLGERMYRALRRHPCAILIGSDCPALKPADLRAAARALREGADAVLAPAEDGGYVLIGLRRISRRLFDGVPWGGPQVLARTRGRLAALRWRWRELRMLWDVDRPEDVARLRRSRLLGKQAGKLRSRRTSAAGRRRVRPSSGSPSRSGAPGRPSGWRP